jgi:hypothetical protein
MSPDLMDLPCWGGIYFGLHRCKGEQLPGAAAPTPPPKRRADGHLTVVPPSPTTEQGGGSLR